MEFRAPTYTADKKKRRVCELTMYRCIFLTGVSCTVHVYHPDHARVTEGMKIEGEGEERETKERKNGTDLRVRSSLRVAAHSCFETFLE
jgi:hypothetical protein